MRILAGAALALSTVFAVSMYTAPAEARDRDHRDRAHHGDHHHHGNRHKRRGGLKIGIGEDGIYISKRRKHRHHRRHH